MHKLTITVPVYQFKCIVVIDSDIEKRINSYTKRNCWEGEALKEDETVHGMAVSTKSSHNYYIFYDIASLNANVITHEVSHLVDYVLEHKGIEDGEARAYLSGYINEKIFDYVIKNQLFINKWLKEKEEKNQKSSKKVQEQITDTSLLKDNS
jgi:hypothetical protein